MGGISIPHNKHSVGHSDADVLLHAITDAILGAASLGDIGDMFPNTLASNRNRSSADMLAAAYHRAIDIGYRIVNLDCIIFIEHPKLGRNKTVIQERVAEILGLTVQQVGIKAKTGEHVGAVGREECIMAQCVALLSHDK